MKKILWFFTVALIASCLWSQSSVAPKRQWRATIMVVDETNRPVVAASVNVSYYDTPPPGKTEASRKIGGLTDANGTFIISQEDTGSVSLGFQANKRGYYTTTKGYTLGMSYEYDPVIWNPNITMALKKIGRPTALYAKRVNLGMPVFEKPAGFDFEVGDWIAPYGKGINADIIFTGHFVKKNTGESDYSLTVSFPNSGDGIRAFSAPSTAQEGYSDLRSDHEAPLDGYQSHYVQTDNRMPGHPSETNRDKARNYYFRVRTVLDVNGNVKSALYGKIYGDFMRFDYYLNPAPNSRNVEFDPKQNLLGGLKSTEQVSAP